MVISFPHEVQLLGSIGARYIQFTGLNVVGYIDYLLIDL